MNLSRPNSDIYVPDGADPDVALSRTTHLCVIAHQDDIEINAYPAVAECYENPNRFFTGVTVTNGSGSSRTGPFADHTDDQMQAVRAEEQREAARLGQYNLQLQLGYPSSDVKQAGQPPVLDDLTAIFSKCRPEVVYLHQPLDKHDTHVAVMLRCIEAYRRLPRAERPKKILGIEAWRGLDWLLDDEKIALDSSAHPELALKLMQVFASQIAGGKHYDRAALGRRQANATFHSSHASDVFTEVTWAIDLTPLILDETLSVNEFAQAHVNRLRNDVADRIARMS